MDALLTLDVSPDPAARPATLRLADAEGRSSTGAWASAQEEYK